MGVSLHTHRIKRTCQESRRTEEVVFEYLYRRSVDREIGLKEIMKYTRHMTAKMDEELYWNVEAVRKGLKVSQSQLLRLALEELVQRYPLESFERELI